MFTKPGAARRLSSTIHKLHARRVVHSISSTTLVLIINKAPSSSNFQLSKRTPAYLRFFREIHNSSNLNCWTSHSRQDQMTHRYTAWHAIARLLGDIVLILRTSRTYLDGRPRRENYNGARSDVRASCLEREIGETHTADAFCPAANDNCSAASTGTVLPIYVVCSLGGDIDHLFAESRPASS